VSEQGELDEDPVLNAIREEAARMLADPDWIPGRQPKKKAPKVAALAPTIRALREKGLSWRGCEALCKTKGLLVAAKTIRLVMLELDDEERRANGETLNSISDTASRPSTTRTSSRKHTAKPRSKRRRTPRADTPEASAGTLGTTTEPSRATRNGRHDGELQNVAGRAVEPQPGPSATPVATRVVELAAPSRGDVDKDVRDLPAAADATTANEIRKPATRDGKRRFGAKGMDF